MLSDLNNIRKISGLYIGILPYMLCQFNNIDYTVFKKVDGLYMLQKEQSYFKQFVYSTAEIINPTKKEIPKVSKFADEQLEDDKPTSKFEVYVNN